MKERIKWIFLEEIKKGTINVKNIEDEFVLIVKSEGLRSLIDYEQINNKLERLFPQEEEKRHYIKLAFRAGIGRYFYEISINQSLIANVDPYDDIKRLYQKLYLENILDKKVLDYIIILFSRAIGVDIYRMEASDKHKARTMTDDNSGNDSPNKRIFLEPEDEEERKTKNKRWKKLVIGIAIGISVVGIAGAKFYQIKTATSNLLVAIEEEDFQKAKEIYEENFNELPKRAEDMLEEKIEGLVEQFEEKELGYNEVIQKLEDIELLYDGSKRNVAEDKIEDLNNSREMYAKAEEYRENGNIKDAISFYGKVIKEDSNYRSAMSNREFLINNYCTEQLEEADGLVVNKNFTQAIKQLENNIAYLNSLSIDETYIQLRKDELSDRIVYYQELQEEQEIEVVLSNAEEKVTQYGYRNAIQFLAPYLKEYPNNVSLESYYEEICNLYKEKMLKEIKKLVVAENYTGALDKTQEALLIFKNDEKLLSIKKELQPEDVTQLTTLPFVKNDHVTLLENSITDAVGQEHYVEDGLLKFDTYRTFDSWLLGVGLFEQCVNSYAEYYLNGEYDILQTEVFALEEFSYNHNISLRVYLDNSPTPAFEIKEFSRHTIGQSITVNVTGATYMKIWVGRDDYGSNDGSGVMGSFPVLLSNATLLKKIDVPSLDDVMID